MNTKSIYYFPSMVIKNSEMWKKINYINYLVKVSDDGDRITIQVYVEI